MNKYKVGDKIVLTVSDVNEKAYYSYYVFNNNDLILWEPSTDNYAEPLTTYTEPLEAKIRRQAAEITRLLAENKELKNEKQELTRERNQLMGRCGGLSAAKIKAFNNGRLAGQNEAWELAKKIVCFEWNGGYTLKELLDIFQADSSPKILNEHTYHEAAAKVEAWEKATIKRGDEVEKNDLRDARFIVTFTNGKLMSGVTQSGLVFSNEKTKDWHKTGRRMDIDGFLKQIGEEQK